MVIVNMMATFIDDDFSKEDSFLNIVELTEGDFIRESDFSLIWDALLCSLSSETMEWNSFNRVALMSNEPNEYEEFHYTVESFDLIERCPIDNEELEPFPFE